MEKQTNTANTQDWLEASRGTRIRPYVEAYMSTLNLGDRPLRQESFDEALKSISVPILEVDIPVVGPQFDLELQAWDVLSDEALSNFEQNLD